MKPRTPILLRHPVVIILPVVVLLWAGWQDYLYRGRNFSLPAQQKYLLTDASGSNNQHQWKAAMSGHMSYSFGLGKAVLQGDSYDLAVSQYKDGDASLSTPKTNVHSHTSYLFKGYYHSSTRFTLLARYWHVDGTIQLVTISRYPANPSGWSTVSDAFSTSDKITAAQFVYQLSSNGTLSSQGDYLEPSTDVVVAPPDANLPNLIPNPELQTDSYSMPTSWNPYHSGDSQAAYSYLWDSAGPYLQAQLSGYKSGQAKWQYPAQSVEPGQYYKFQADIKSTVASSLVAEYVLANGSQQFVTLQDCAPTDQWTRVDSSYVVPPDAAYMFVSVVISGNGSLGTRNYVLNNVTSPPSTAWPSPVVSITFNDGWQSSYLNAVAAMNKYHYEATYYINPSTIELPGYMTAVQLGDLHKSGNEIAAEGYYHEDLTAINSNRLDYNLSEGQSYLADAGFATRDMAAPYGRIDPQVVWYARKYFSTLIGSEPGINTQQNLNPYNLLVYNVGSYTSDSQLRATLAAAKGMNGWLILVYGQLGSSGSDVSAGTFSRQMAIIHASGIEVSPVRSAYASRGLSIPSDNVASSN